MLYLRGKSIGAAAALSLGLAVSSAWGLTITPITSTDPNSFIPLLVNPTGGVIVVPGSGTFQGAGALPTPGEAQSGSYTGFNLAPSSGSTPTLVLPDGIALSSGLANVPLSNTSGSFARTTGSGPNAQLTAIAPGNSPTQDANVLSFQFTVTPGQNAVNAVFVFGTEEFPTQSVTDIFGFFVDGVNYAKFPGGQVISNIPEANFIPNTGQYGIEYNGLTPVFQVTGLLDPNLAVHTLTVGIANTNNDSLFQSGVFIGNLIAGVAQGQGGIGEGIGGGNGGTVPEPGVLALLGVGLGALSLIRRRRSEKSA